MDKELKMSQAEIEQLDSFMSGLLSSNDRIKVIRLMDDAGYSLPAVRQEEKVEIDEDKLRAFLVKNFGWTGESGFENELISKLCQHFSLPARKEVTEKEWAYLIMDRIPALKDNVLAWDLATAIYKKIKGE